MLYMLAGFKFFFLVYIQEFLALPSLIFVYLYSTDSVKNVVEIKVEDDGDLDDIILHYLFHGHLG